ncbi:MAG: thioredoxin [Anaerovoracaceae bacterium]|nr:thioredoxin [Bacillota bacterium]
MSVVTLTKDNFEQEVLKSDKPVLVDFWAAWCGPCRMVGPVVEQIAGEHPEYKVGKIDVDDQPELAGQFSIMSIPTLLVFKDGKVHNKTVGVTSKENLLKLFG